MTIHFDASEEAGECDQAEDRPPGSRYGENDHCSDRRGDQRESHASMIAACQPDPDTEGSNGDDRRQSRCQIHGLGIGSEECHLDGPDQLDPGASNPTTMIKAAKPPRVAIHHRIRSSSRGKRPSRIHFMMNSMKTKSIAGVSTRDSHS